MSVDEREAILALVEAWNKVIEVLPDAQDRAEAMFHMHGIQRIVMAQSVIRSDPALFRQRTS